MYVDADEMGLRQAQLERNFFIWFKQESELMERKIDILCRGQEKGFCQSFGYLDRTSMGRGFIKNRRAAVELFQVRSSFYGKLFDVVISINNSQLLKLLKFDQREDGESGYLLDYGIFNLCIVNRKFVMISPLKREISCFEDNGQMGLGQAQRERNFHKLIEQWSGLMEGIIDILCRGQEKDLP
jgi:hypothetical protein